MKRKVLLDTDIGSDIDDAVCLAYLLAQGDCDLMGVTTVSGQPEKRAMMASAMCTVAQKNVPIFPGTESPMASQQRQPEAPQAGKLANWDHETSFPKGAAIEFMRQTIRNSPHEIDLVAIGPMTNLGLLFSVDPEIPVLLRSLTLMLGRSIEFPNATRMVEWNAMCDPHAAAIVYRAPIPVHRSVGLDVTMKVTMGARDVQERFRSRLLRPVLDFAQVWFEHADRIVFHDPLAATTLFDNTICTFKRGTVEIELDSPKLAGMTLWTPEGDDPRHEVATSVHPDRFFEHYLSLFPAES